MAERNIGKVATCRTETQTFQVRVVKGKGKYLGHVVSPGGVAANPDKIEAIRNWPSPVDLKSLQAVLGMAGYYRQYLKSYATDAKPLSRLTSKDAPCTWAEAEEAAFGKLKKGLLIAPVLGYNNSKQTNILDTDASAVSVGAVLSQVQEGSECAIAYYNNTLSHSECNYCVTQWELLAVVKTVKHFRPYLYGHTLILRTDYASLRRLCRKKESSAKVTRPKYGNAYGLSWKEYCKNCTQCELIERRDGGPSRLEVEELSQLAQWRNTLWYQKLELSLQ